VFQVMNSQFSGCGSTTWTVPTGPEDVAAAMMPPSISCRQGGIRVGRWEGRGHLDE
jgi:hypothetical protein